MSGGRRLLRWGAAALALLAGGAIIGYAMMRVAQWILEGAMG